MYQVRSVNHQYYLMSRDSRPTFPVGTNGFIAAQRNICLILTGTASGCLGVSIQVLEEAPGPPDLNAWSEIVEAEAQFEPGVVLTARGLDPVAEVLRQAGRYRIRAHARNRDAGRFLPEGSNSPEVHLLQLWPVAVRTPGAVLRVTDDFGRMWREGDPFG